MENCAKIKLEKLGYQIDNVPYTYIDSCNAWYEGERIDGFHKRMSVNGEEYEIDRMNFAKRGCADDANLCELISINTKDDAMSKEINRILENNRFDVMYRKQLEKMAATGTVGAYIWLDNATYLDNGKAVGGKIRISYCFAENYIPLKVQNDEVIEAAFTGTEYTRNGKKITLVVFSVADTLYKADTYIFNDTGEESEYYSLQLGEVKPFAIMRVAEVNNLNHMNGFGLPKLWGAIPILKKLDLCNMILNGDLEKGEKFVLTNEALIEIDPHTGKPKERNSMWKRLFVFLGKKPIDARGYIQEYNPQIRIEEISRAFELCLSLFSMIFGFGTKKYTFENGEIKTATEYIGERQDSMQELNKQRKEAADYIRNLIKAILWFSNTFRNTKYELDAEICIDFDDSYVEDKNAVIENMRSDAISFADIPEFTIRYIMMRLNVDEDKAKKIYENRQEEEEPETED
ncbi:MAG: phage portal protein [Bacteroidales bacterium]|nr:phage portal protein [Clostridium sp.]MCM1204739.1 phage portal protein [Bacteroidales bacterium]